MSYTFRMGGGGSTLDSLGVDDQIVGRVIFLTQPDRHGDRGRGVAVHEVASGIAHDVHRGRPTAPGMYEARAAVHLKAAAKQGLIEPVPGSRATRLRYWATPAGDEWLRGKGVHTQLEAGDEPPRPPADADGTAEEMRERELPAPRRQLPRG